MKWFKPSKFGADGVDDGNKSAVADDEDGDERERERGLKDVDWAKSNICLTCE